MLSGILILKGRVMNIENLFIFLLILLIILFIIAFIECKHDRGILIAFAISIVVFFLLFTFCALLHANGLL